MFKIAFLQSKSTTNQIFSSEELSFISKLGSVVMNEEDSNPSTEQVKSLIREADIAITSWGCPKLEKDVLDSAPNLKLVLHAAGSVKGIISQELWERGIRVSGAAEALGKGVAETALGLTICSLKNLWQLSNNTKKGEWHKDRNRVREIYNVTIGVIGGGRAGKHYIRLLKNFDANVLIYDPIMDKDEAKLLGATKVELEDLLKKSDVVSIHAPSIPATYKMLNKERLMLMKDEGIIINTARGSIIDEEALIEELKKGRLFACLDVTEPEPPVKDHPFRSLPNVVLTPHIAGAVNNGLYRIGKYISEEIVRYLNGDKMDGEVYREKLDTIA